MDFKNLTAEEIGFISDGYSKEGFNVVDTLHSTKRTKFFHDAKDLNDYAKACKEAAKAFEKAALYHEEYHRAKSS